MNELDVLVAPARIDEAPAIAEMSRDLIEQGLVWSWTPARVLRSIAGKDSQVLVARCGPGHHGASASSPRIAGFAIMHFGDEVAHLNLFAVAPDHRRRGLGRRLMQWLTLTAIECGIFRIDLELRTYNTQARSFYENLGFGSQGVVQGYYQGREAALRMSRRLSA